MVKITSIYRYPVKGLSAEKLDQVAVTPFEGLPLDRVFTLALSATGYDPASPGFIAKTKLIVLLRHERLAALRTNYDSDNRLLTISLDGRVEARADPFDDHGRREIEEFIARFLAKDLRDGERPTLVHAPGHNFFDVPEKWLSLVNLASVRALGKKLRQTLDPIRFRANVYFDGARPWSEFDWAGRTIRIGAARLRVVRPISRCAATDVNPETAERDQNLPRSLMRAFGHAEMGVYAEVISAGAIGAGDSLELVRIDC